VIRHARVSVGTTPAALTSTQDNSQVGSRLQVRNTSATDAVSLGASDVTAATGYELRPGSSLLLTLDADEALYAVAALGTVEVHVLRMGVR
jgi:hypothetical protein